MHTKRLTRCAAGREPLVPVLFIMRFVRMRFWISLARTPDTTDRWRRSRQALPAYDIHNIII